LSDLVIKTKLKENRHNVNLLTGIVLMKNVYYSNLEYIFNLWAKTRLIKEKELVVFFIRYIVETEDMDAKKAAELLKGSRERFYPQCKGQSKTR